MPRAKKEYSQGESVLALMNIPEILGKSSELVSALQGIFKFAGDEKPSEMLEYWETTNKMQKFRFLGWLKGGLDRLQFRAVQYIDLYTKLELEYAVIAILRDATEEEKEVYNQSLNFVKQR